MSVTLQFAIGQKQAILDAVKNSDFDFLDVLESQNQIADFSLHITPNDLNFLVNIASELRNLNSIGLREFLDTTTYFFDSEVCGAYLVNIKISTLFSEFQEDEAFEITNKWFKRMETEYNEEILVNNDAIESVKKMIDICKKSQKDNLDLVHIWFL
jgi:hypothetical protein